MAIPNISSLLEISNPQLVQSANSLESALAKVGKLSASIESSVPGQNMLPSGGKGFDEWLATDLQYGILLSGVDKSLTASPRSVQDDSPLLEYEAFYSNAAPSLFEYSIPHPSVGTYGLTSQDLNREVEQTAVLGLTTSKLQCAAAALNIPWSHELQRAVLEQTMKLPSGVLSPQATSLLSMSNADLSSKNTRAHVKRSRTPDEEESEETLAKRVKNTDAARRSRLKKLVKLEGLEVKVGELETTNQSLSTRIAVLETERNGFLIKEAEQNARIAQLEAKIMEAQLALKTRGP
ncbi:hypothetical protein EDD11_008594 [Mortierella claussenii]|nr:hypothetical protein EDD11_008594 [Mortierella claussenii]